MKRPAAAVGRAGCVLKWLFFALAVALTARAHAIERVRVLRQGRPVLLEGQVVTEAADGGLLLLAADGVLWALQPDEILGREKDDTPFRPLGPEQVGSRLLEELPNGFRLHTTAHYLICYETSPAYAQWCGSLFERLYMAFTNYWSRRGFELKKPQFPLVAIVFASQPSYVNYARAELGEAASQTIGCYSLHTNRMAMYDLTGIEALGGGRSRIRSSVQINRILAQPQAFRTVSTVVHEATHQIAFNCGLHQRFSDCPTWFSEGIAIYFETPDLTSRRGWRSVGEVNLQRLQRFRQYLRRRPRDSLRRLIATDERFRDPNQALDAYAEAWALTYFLLARYSDRYIVYLRTLSQKQPGVMDTPEKRVEEFCQAFGPDLEQLDGELIRYMSRLR